MRDRFSRLSLTFAAFALLAGCSGGGNGAPPVERSTTAPITNPTIAPTNSPVLAGPTASSGATANPSAFTCPTSDTDTDGTVRSASRSRARRAVARFGAAKTAPAMLEVTYATSTATRSALATRESTLGVKAAREIDFAAIGRTTRLVPIGAANAATLASSLRSQAGVLSVAVEGARRHPMAVTTSYYPNDPYFNGFTTTVPSTTGATPPPATYHVAPYSESASVPGQWNMHAVGLEKAFAYSQSNNGSGIVNAGALGSSSIKLAIVDTGADTTIPELKGKIVAQGCFITNESGTAQSTSNFVTDEDGHGTDTSGIAAANTGNAFGFTGAGGNVSLMEYRVNPTPDDNCLTDGSSDPTCSSDVTDVADAIMAATNAGANVISLSLGGGGCSSSGADDDAVEGNALAAAFAKNVVVVASAGNDGLDTDGLSAKGTLAAPACVSGVIAAGASALSDGAQTGSGVTTGTASAPAEYVASYSQYGTPAAAPESASAWGIVAPGGDPGDADTSSSTTTDDLHWIEDTYTSTPADPNFAGECDNDYPNGSLSSNPDCRILIAGTSMSAPTIAGAAALLISANSAYQSPSAMKSLLCTTADDIGDGHEGCGRLDVYRAMAKAVGDSASP